MRTHLPSGLAENGLPMQAHGEHVASNHPRTTPALSPPPTSPDQPPFSFALFHRVLPAWFWKAGFLKLAQDLLMFVSPAVQSTFLTWLQTPGAPIAVGYVTAALLLVAPILASLFGQHYLAIVLEGSMNVRLRTQATPAPCAHPRSRARSFARALTLQVRAAMLASLHRKSMRLSASARGRHSEVRRMFAPAHPCYRRSSYVVCLSPPRAR